jgi:hypothetical protein
MGHIAKNCPARREEYKKRNEKYIMPMQLKMMSHPRS